MNNIRALLLVMCFIIPTTVNAATINFDNLSAPELLADQTPLTNEYELSMGILFEGLGEVLNQNGNGSGVPITAPFSSPNYLAFGISDESVPVETMLFSSAMSYFDLDFAGTGGTITVTAFFNGVNVGSNSIDATFGIWNEMSLSGITFNRVELSVNGTDGSFAVDNLNFTAAVPVPAAIWLFISGLAGLFGIRKLK